VSAHVIAFIVVFIFAVLLFAWSCRRRFGLVFRGRPDRRFDKPLTRLGNMLLYAFGQRRVVSKPFGLNHFTLFWAFMVLLLANTEFLVNGLAPAVSYARLPDGAFFTLALIFDIVSALAFLSVVIAMIRRLFFPPPHIEARSRDAFIILGAVAVLMLAFFSLKGADITLDPRVGRAAAFMPVSDFFGTSIWGGLSNGALEAASRTFWWIHAVVLLGFLNYLPYSKHMHVLTAIENCFFKSLDKVRTQARETFVRGNTFGAGSYDLFPWKGLFDAYACTECGRCSDNCPATFTGKSLDPRLVIHDIKVNMLRNGLKGEAPPQALIGDSGEGSVTEETLWDCTTCGACMEVCPVFIEHVPRIVDMRRHLVETEAKFPEELLNLFENMENRSNPWGQAPAERTKWAADLDVQPFEAGKTEYLFFVGCAGAFDARNRKTTQSLAKILDAAGVSWGTFGRDELCCGDSLRRLGNEYLFDEMVRQNLALFEEKGVTKIITQCPHCFSTLKNDYRQYGVELEVVHHSVFIRDLIASGRLKLAEKVGDPGNLYYHDSCYLGRYNGVYEPPREVLAAATGSAPAELGRNRDKGFCCGAGGGRMWLEEEIGKQVNVARVEEALAHKADTVCVACPYCMTMFEDGLQFKEAGDTVKVLDLAEVVARALPE
jgi:Fe-S oxidoreductase